MRKLSLSHLVVFLCLSVFVFATYSIAKEKDGLLRVYFMDVGQGDAIFIEAPNGNQVLIDGGPDNKVIQELAEVMPFYDHSIDMIVLTHPHADHVAGLIEVLNRYDVGKILEAKETYDSPIVPTWKESIKNEGVEEVEPIVGQTIDLGNGASLEILYPFGSLADTVIKNPNNDSVVMMLTYGKTKTLLVGDIETSVEKQLLNSGVNLRADILKVGHHGSKTSTTENFLRTVDPQLAFIEVGVNNIYHHPSLEVIQRLEKFGIKYYRTDTDGHTEIVSDGQNFKVIKY
jgi:competence protein ComEC